MAGLDWRALEAASLRREPFDHIHVDHALDAPATARILEHFPPIHAPGSFSLTDAPPGPVLSAVIDDLQSDRFRRLMEAKFDLDLSHRSTTVTLRGRSGARDGFIHTDSRSKILSLLLYLNDDWKGSDGQLRLLRNGRDLNDFEVEVPAHLGSLLVFRRSDVSWHGHTAFSGPRRVLQFNYVRSDYTSLVSTVRHRFSALIKPQRVA